jgi:hypothetical protein
MTVARRPHSAHPDRGIVLPLVLVITIALGAVIVAVASFATTSLTYGRVAEDRSDRLAAADAGMRYAIDQIKLKARGCVWDDALHELPGITSDFNGATAEVECQRITSGLDDIKLYAAAMTGEGVPASGSDSFLLAAQGGTDSKVLGGPVYMERIDSFAFNFGSGPGVEIEEGPLLYFDPAVPCTPVKPSVVATRTIDKLIFTPDLIFGPECQNQTWQQKFGSPEIPAPLSDPTIYSERDGTTTLGVAAPLATVTNASLAALAALPGPGSYLDVTDGGGCRVYVPGRYTTPPATNVDGAYFLSGEYIFDFPNTDSTFGVRHGVITAGKPNPAVFLPAEVVDNEIVNTTACDSIQALDPAPEPGATFYFARNSHMVIETNGSLEIHGRKQGGNFVSVQTLCKTSDSYCAADGTGGFNASIAKWSTLNPTDDVEILYTNSGNNKEFVAHGLFYAPLAEAEFGNATNTAIQKMKGGLIVAQLILQSSASATNFEIAVPTSPITGQVQITSTAEKNGKQTSIRAVVEYRPYEALADDRIKVNSWRVCERASCL